MNRIARLAAGTVALLGLLSAAPLSTYAATPTPFLGTASQFAVLGGAGVTCTKSSVALGAVGSKLTVTKTATCSIAGAIHAGDATLAPGVYCFNKTAGLTSGILTLAGPSSGVWVFQVGTGLTTAASQVVMASGGQACNVYWALGTTGTIGTGSKFQGNLLAGSSLVGRALAKTAVTMTGTNLRLPSNWDASTCRQTP
jgi:hypothetical protein